MNKPLRVWLINVGEPLPTDGKDVRLCRTGMIAKHLSNSGAEVVWWTSTFDHLWKRHRVVADCRFQVTENYGIKLLQGTGYTRNVSVRRLIDHAVVARRFALEAPEIPRPDVILCSYPTIELSLSAVLFGEANGVPVVLDIRDLWPDIFLDSIQKAFAPIGRALLVPYVMMARKALSQCTALVGITENYLQWGLQYAQRERSTLDAVFPLAYEQPVVGEQNAIRATERLKTLGVDPEKKIVWFIGTFGNTYDLSTVIEAARKLQDDGMVDVQFVISGEGERFSSHVANAKGVDNIVFTGWIDQAEISHMMDVACVGLASYAEGAPQSIPNKLGEYFCAALPIVSSLRGEAELLIERRQCGLTYRAGDVAHLIEGLETLLHDERRLKEAGAASYAVYKELFCADTTWQAMHAYLETVARV